MVLYAVRQVPLMLLLMVLIPCLASGTFAALHSFNQIGVKIIAFGIAALFGTLALLILGGQWRDDRRTMKSTMRGIWGQEQRFLTQYGPECAWVYEVGMVEIYNAVRHGSEPIEFRRRRQTFSWLTRTRRPSGGEKYCFNYAYIKQWIIESHERLWEISQLVPLVTAAVDRTKRGESMEPLIEQWLTANTECQAPFARFVALLKQAARDAEPDLRQIRERLAEQERERERVAKEHRAFMEAGRAIALAKREAEERERAAERVRWAALAIQRDNEERARIRADAMKEYSRLSDMLTTLRPLAGHDQLQSLQSRRDAIAALLGEL